jgi:arylsulfatase A-like enzyme
MADQRPNLILINVDQWRADALSFLGHPVVETPHLDGIAARGVHFRQAYTAVPSCIAARASLLTGLTPRSHGRVGYRDGVDWDYEVTLPGLLADAGYHTQAVGKMHVSPARNLMGFHNVILHDGYLHYERLDAQDLHLVDDYLPWLRAQHGPFADYVDTGIGCNGYVVRPWVYEDMLHPTAWVTSQAVDFLRRRDPRKPFFLFVSYHRPHPPLDPPADYLAMYEQKPLPPLPEGAWSEVLPDSMGALDSPIPRDPAQRDRARRAYYAQITFIDHQLNRLIHALHAHGVLDDTAILFCSDHGEMLYDHGLVAKATPYDGSARVPFLLMLPQSWEGSRGATVDAPVALRDVLPTLCDLAGVPVPESVEGRSVVPFCRDESPAWRSFIHGEHAAGPWSNQWLTDGEWKYVWFSQQGIEQLFHLAEDPQEMHDLASERSAVVARWRERLIDALAGREEGYVQDGDLVVGQTPQRTLGEAGLPGEP